ncbi:MAG: hypothetical protein ACRYGG_03175 [Janthinobacterium lividum]
MSSELLDLLEDDEHGNNVRFRMDVHGHAWLSVIDYMEGREQGRQPDPSYHLTPDESGKQRALLIAQALTTWADHATGFDVTPFINCPLDPYAKALAAQFGLTYRVVSEDGVSFPQTCDLDMRRVNFTVVDGYVRSAEIG